MALGVWLVAHRAPHLAATVAAERQQQVATRGASGASS